MAQRCNTPWVNERAITVQFDKYNLNVSIASFLIVRPAYAWLGYGANYVWPPTWNDAFLLDVGEPVGECAQTAPGVFEREWTFGTATMDCNSYTATVPCNPADKTCGEPPRPPVPPFVPANFSASHNCTGCGGAGGVQLGDSLVNLSFEECLAYCEANALCKYVNWLEPPGDIHPLWRSFDHAWYAGLHLGGPDAVGADEAQRLLTAHIEQSKLEVRKITLDMLYQARNRSRAAREDGSQST